MFNKYTWNEHHASACKLNKENPISHPSSSIPPLYIQWLTFRVHVEKTLKVAPELHFTVDMCTQGETLKNEPTHTVPIGGKTSQQSFPENSPLPVLPTSRLY